MALLLTTGTNLLGIATVPFLMYTLLGTGDLGGVLDPVQLLISLIKTILVPILLGASARALVPGERIPYAPPWVCDCRTFGPCDDSV